LVELRAADDSKLVVVGTLLCFANIFTLFLALYLQVNLTLA
jgi:hypothetical protein